MAIVYLARDTKHDRSVALKVLRPELRESVAAERFLQEVQMTARLTHPHILPLLDSGAMGGVLYYVMPHVEGDSLRARLKREQQLTIAESVRIASEIAEALDFAHRAGIVHRDIKPENILLEDGRAVIADFGIARALTRAAGHSLTGTGLSVGTPSYMSPEQASGVADIDGRSDIYALGCVLHEMIAGEPPFTGPTVQAVIAKTLSLAPIPLRQLRISVPEALQNLALRALAKVPADRYQSAAEMRGTLEEIIRKLPSPGLDQLSGPVSASPENGASIARPKRRLHRTSRAIWVPTVILIALLTGIAAVVLRRDPTATLVVKHAFQLTYEPSLEFDPAISPDGQFVAYATGGRGYPTAIHVRQLAGGRPVTLTDSTIIAPRWPRWSPDGTRIAFTARDGIYLVPTFGGTARRVIATSKPLFGTRSPVWSPDGSSLAYATDSAIHMLDVAKETTRTVAEVPGCGQLSWSLDGIWLAYTFGNSLGAENIAPSTVYVVRAKGGHPIKLSDSLSVNLSPVWMPDNRTLLFVSSIGGGRDIYSIRINRDGLPSGQPIRLTTGLGAATISLSRDGSRLAYATLKTASSIWQVSIRARDSASILNARPLLQRAETIEGMSVSPDGRSLVFDSNLSGNQDIYRMSIGGGEPERLTNDPADDWHGRWSPSGSEIAFYSIRGGTRDIFLMNADGSRQRRVTSDRDQEADPDWSPNGKLLAYSDDFHLFVSERLGPDTFGPPRQLSETRGIKPRWSPDGDSIAYVTTGLFPSVRVMARSGGERTVFTADRGTNPWTLHAAWAAFEHKLYYSTIDRDHGQIIRAEGVRGESARVILTTQDRGFPFDTDGRKLYFKRSSQESDVWILTLAKR